MKKFISVLIAVLLLSSCFVVPAFAQAVDEWGFPVDPVIEFSNDYTKIYYDGYTFKRVDADVLDIYFLGLYWDVVLTDAQQSSIKNVEVEINSEDTVIFATINFKDGMTMSSAYLREDYIDDYNRIASTECEEYTIDFTYPEDNTVIAKKSDLFGETVVFNKSKLGLCDAYEVKATVEEAGLTVIKGFLLIYDEEYYYVDCYETGLPADTYFDYHEFSELSVHRITNPELFADINFAEEEYYDDDYGYLYDDSFTETISAVLIIFVFAIVPLAILVIFLVKAIKGKGVYKKMYFTVSALCVAEIIVFIVIAIIVASGSSAFDFTFTEKTIEEYATEIGVGTNGEKVVLLKEAIYCGDGDCRDGCTTGYFYRDKNCSEEDAMLQLELGEKTDNMYDHIDNAVIYNASWSENIVVNTTEFSNGYIVEYQVIGVG